MSVTVFQTPIIAEGGEAAGETPEITDGQETNPAGVITEETKESGEEDDKIRNHEVRSVRESW